jgi:hypothetical protein
MTTKKSGGSICEELLGFGPGDLRYWRCDLCKLAGFVFYIKIILFHISYKRARLGWATCHVRPLAQA